MTWTMRIIHHISINTTSEIRRELAALGVVVGQGLVSFDLDECHESWPRVRSWIRRRKAVDVVHTKFSSEEIAAAQWLELIPAWHHGYPQPDEEHFGYLRATYDLTDYCTSCGIGAKQRAPFLIRTEPKWGRRGVLQLNWVFDEFFVTPDVWEGVFKPYGIDRRAVLSSRGAELSTVVQLVPKAPEVAVETDDLTGQRCATCGRIKYLPVTRGPFPALVSEPSAKMTKTKQYFGSGASAHRRVIISQDVARALAEMKIRGASMRPVATPHQNIQSAGLTSKPRSGERLSPPCAGTARPGRRPSR